VLLTRVLPALLLLQINLLKLPRGSASVSSVCDAHSVRGRRTGER
jgi:hypothetical protein